ncbi:MAG TPA: tetratricopeptide repeat protein, partial [Bacteroidales bacterium]|nr:tetratricopeptide repeat protein [Bacteroidales bacterium]
MGRIECVIFLIFLFTISCSQTSDEEISADNVVDKTLPGTDSLVVEQLIEKSNSHYGQGGVHIDITDSYLKEAEDIARKNENTAQLSRIYNLLGQRFRNRAQYGTAMTYHQKALDLATRIEDKVLLANVYNQIGVVYRRIDDNPMALEMHVKALSL